ncbi:MAG: hypothetical protein ACE5IK_02345 [Acidobacteriota bacterium]
MHSPRFQRPLNKLTRIGLWFLIVASVMNYLVARRLVPHNDVTDLMQGLLYGVCFAASVAGVRGGSRGCRPGPSEAE